MAIEKEVDCEKLAIVEKSLKKLGYKVINVDVDKNFEFLQLLILITAFCLG